MPKISVIIPVYNAERYLRECLDSVVNQTLKDIEIICVDDGSVDSSLEIIESYKKKDDRVVIFSQRNYGAGVARNNGLKLANGDYISFMDSDDFYPDERVLLDLYNAVINNNVKIAGGSLIEILPNLTKRNYYPSSDARQFNKDGYVHYIDYQYDYYYQRFLYSKKFLMDNNLYFPLCRRHQDVLFFVKTMITAVEFFSLKRSTYCYRVDNNKVVWKKEIAWGIIATIKEVMKIAKKNNLNYLYRRLLKRLIKQYIVMFFCAIGLEKNIVNFYQKFKKKQQEKNSV